MRTERMMAIAGLQGLLSRYGVSMHAISTEDKKTWHLVDALDKNRDRMHSSDIDTWIYLIENLVERGVHARKMAIKEAVSRAIDEA